MAGSVRVLSAHFSPRRTRIEGLLWRPYREHIAVMTGFSRRALVVECERLAKAGCYARAIELMRAYLKENPQDAEALHSLADIRQQQERSSGIAAHGSGDDDANYIDHRADEIVNRRKFYESGDEDLVSSSETREIASRHPATSSMTPLFTPKVSYEGSASECSEEESETDDTQSQFIDCALTSPARGECQQLVLPLVNVKGIDVASVPIELDVDTENGEGLDEAGKEEDAFLVEADELDFEVQPMVDPSIVRTRDAVDDNWPFVDDDIPEFDESLTRDEFLQVETEGHVSHRERARQIAGDLGLRYGWDRNGIELLTDVFEKYWWSAAQRSMERELEAGLLPDELSLALESRQVWECYEEFGENLKGYAYPSLPWPTALEIVRSFRGYPDIAEIEVFLLDTYACWRSSLSQMRVHSSFLAYLKTRLAFPQQLLFVGPNVSLMSIGVDDACDDDYFGGAHLGFNTFFYRSLEQYGLLPAVWENPVGTARNTTGRDDDSDESDGDD